MDFTREQEQAITSRGEDILVSAGAGAGKTRVLVTRICEMIMDREHPVPADQLLVLTFTNAAAKEMKERISLELKERLEKDPENRYLRRQIRAVRHADISTIHSFCHHLIRTHFNELGIDPSFRIGDDTELKPLKQEAMEKLLEDRYLSGEQSFFDLVEAYAPGRTDLALEGIIDRTYTFVRGFPDSDGWFSVMEKDFASMMDPEGLKQSRIIRILTEEALRKIVFCRQSTERAIRITEDTGGPDQVLTCLIQEKEETDRLIGLKDYPSLQKGLSEFPLPAYPRKTGKLKEWVPFDEVKKSHELLKKTVNDLLKSVFAKDPQEIIREQEMMYPLLKECIFLVRRFAEIYLEGKREKNIYDFNDLEHFTLELLTDSYGEDGQPVPSEEAVRIAGRYKAVFVDEYQDTSLIQETIIKLLTESGENNLFVVGDVKQSIYRFRQARPDLFLKRYHRYEAGEGLKIELRDNFRSSPDVLDFCNRIFSCWMKEDFGGIEYNDEIKLVPGSGGPMAEKHFPQEAMLLIRDPEEEDEGEIDKTLAETAMIAKRIRQLHDEEGYGYDDMVILLRSVKSSGELMADYLENLGIPTVCGNETGYFRTREIRVILNYLSVVDNVFQDIPMASVMLSGIGGFSGEDIARLKVLADPSRRSHIWLYDLMKYYLENGKDEPLKEKITRFLDLLHDFRGKKQEMLLHELVWEICRRTGFYEQILAMPRGEKRICNLMMLIQQAKNYEKNVYKGLFYFIRHMEELRTYEVEPGDNSMEDSSASAVKIMTIHKSKGLEFPVVFVSMLSRQFMKQDNRDKIFLHPGLGMGMDVFYPSERISSPSVIKQVIGDQLVREGMEEELRVLYVAMTRARERLILTSVVDRKKMDAMESGEPLFPAPESAKSFLDWILPVLRENNWENCTKIRMDQLAEDMDDSGSRLHISLNGMMEEAGNRAVDTEPVRQAFRKTYPYDYCVGWKRKFSVSELKKLAMERLEGEEVPFLEIPAAGEEEPVPAFLGEKQEEESGGTAYGTLVHKVMELLPFDRITEPDSLPEELDRILESADGGFPGLKNRIFSGVSAFLFSEEGTVFREMASGNRLFKELPFTAGLDASLIYPGSRGGERIVLQGIVDVCGETEDGLWLLGYNTDRIGPGEESVLLDRYRTQMLYYRLALEQMTGKKVIRSLIYSFALKKFIECD